MKLNCISSLKFGTSGARGLVSDMTDSVCYAFAAAFLQSVTGDAKTVVVGHDLRPSSPRIAGACLAAVVSSGKKIVYTGELPTPAIAYYSKKKHVPAFIVTGSHIPFDRNGIKFYRADGEISKADEQVMLHADVELPETVSLVQLPEINEQAYKVYVERYLGFFGKGALNGMKVGFYEHSSVARYVLRDILEGLGAQVISLGRTEKFVPIDTEAVREEDIIQAREWAEEHAFDAIVSTDGDGDRPLIGDEKGEWLRGDVVGVLCARYLKANVVVTPVSCNTAVELCGEFDRVVRTRIGSPYVIEGMEQSADLGTVVGYEANGGFLLGSDVVRNGKTLDALPTRDAVLPIVALLCMAHEKGCKVSELTEFLPHRYTASDRLQNFETEKSHSIIAALRSSPAEITMLMVPDAGSHVTIDNTDGLRVTFTSGDIVHLRPSGNAPELRCYTESNTPERAQKLCKECLERISYQ
ncbi:phosphomannomutase [Prosthecochloris sp. SCSIO W1103]|uniref:phosphomannomutase n=1 Tax=Prosthecochloris sp. SCSIO W1103 TaxID=2992244 RepID=UPI00223DB714|nr:phosphomannomutase [Prosthecochloris sp. SCSIO W1103]UZJ38155.1 phosphomannomutase [Prosthecochloris sp. SCSIO W1103]